MSNANQDTKEGVNNNGNDSDKMETDSPDSNSNEQEESSKAAPVVNILEANETDSDLSKSEADFKNNGWNLLAKLKEKVIMLKTPKNQNEKDEILKLISDSESLLRTKNVREAFNTFFSAQAKINSLLEPMIWKLLWIELGYLAFLILISYFTTKFPNYPLWRGFLNLPYQVVWYGALGGVTVALYGIYSHKQAGNFDPNYKIWYICKPIMGGLFGWFVYMIFFVGLAATQAGQGVNIKTPELPFLIAFLSGFSERFTIRMIDKLMSVIYSWNENKNDKKN